MTPRGSTLKDATVFALGSSSGRMAELTELRDDNSEILRRSTN